MKRLFDILKKIVYFPLVDKLVSLGGVRWLFAEYRLRSQKKRLLIEAKKVIGNNDFNDYKYALEKHWVSYNEYVQYDFPHLSEREREEFVARLKMVYYYWRYVPGYIKNIFRNKYKFLSFFHNYIHRKWLYVPNATYEGFVQLIHDYDCIVKPCNETRGHGVYKIFKNENLGQNDRNLYESFVKQGMLVEQCIESCEELQAFHPESLNTIRIVTIANTKKAEVFGSFFRMGVGSSVVDNAHAGGIYAQIDINTGIIESNGINTNGESFPYHPDSNIKIKGFKIPKWDLICKTCCEAAMLTGNGFTGWDVVLNSKGDIEFIEGNDISDVDVLQSPLHTGIKKRLFALIKEYSGIVMK
jgi:hypothetical protein